jgi:hypothetical protein
VNGARDCALALDAVAALGVLACAFASACGGTTRPSAQPAALDEQEAAAMKDDRAARERRAGHASLEANGGIGAIESALSSLASICDEGKRIDGECAGRTGDLCVAMHRMVRACFEASAEPARCDALRDDIGERVRKRALGPRASGAVAGFCESACELRQTGHGVDEAEAKLDEICASR